MPTPALEDLEVTVLDPSRTNVAVLEVDGLEPTLHPPLPAPTAPLPDVEPTRLSGLPPVAAEPVPDFEATGLPGEAPSPYTAVTCRSCGMPWTPGASRICEGCGVRIAIPAAYLGRKPDPGPRRPEEKTVCPSCASREQVVGQTCRQCGRVVPAKE
jgi:hypothetical protein